jgi:hypothetical protein
MPTTFEATATFPQITKDPNANLDYMVDWTAWLGEDDLSTAQFIDASGALTIANVSHTPKTATAWISGGVVNETYTVTCRVTTAGGRQEDRSFLLNIRER